MKKLQVLALVALAMLGLAGCEKATIQNDATADVYVEAIKNAEGITVYTALHSVISYNGNISSASAKSPNGTAISLVADAIDPGYSYYNTPVETEYLTTLPLPGVYTYTVKFDDGEEKIFTNSLSLPVILPANNMSLTKSVIADTVYVAWDAIANVHAYKVVIMKGTNRVWTSNLFTVDAPPVPPKIKLITNTFNSSGSGVYTIKLIGMYFESTLTYENLQAISTEKKDITL